MKKFEQELIGYIPNLRRYAVALSATSHIHADDLVQDTLERALKKHSFWMRNSNLRAWLFTIMHNLFINQVNHKSLDYVDNEILDNLTSLEEPSHDYYIQQLKQHMERLPVSQKEVMLLISVEGFSYEEVSGILDIPLGTVMSRLHRSRDKLRQLLSKEKLNNNTSYLRRVK